MLYYKVVKKDLCGFTSIYRRVVPEYGLEYKIGEVTTPRLLCGPIAVFRFIGHVKRFLKKHDITSRYSILLGEGRESAYTSLYDRDESFPRCFQPTGTVCVESFKPIIEVFL